ncbi:hypothetical protein NE237_020622 [Protea cynaroides]|uniref:Uncharacterized protein n=1 Tax=Protea cynaroides TaxID=273540 RepID=A0A9Q0H6G7_9MAGN|nr:hypothetical protein NE237_020622 [Protea cynaroides]
MSNNFHATSCNRKLIGARYFCNGYDSTNSKMKDMSEYHSPRDPNRYDTHTASIAAGRYVSPTSTLDYASGVAAGRTGSSGYEERIRFPTDLFCNNSFFIFVNGGILRISLIRMKCILGYARLESNLI